MKKIKRRNIELKPTESSVAPIGSAKEKILPEGERQGIDEIQVYSVHVLYLTLQSMIFTILHHL